jgi:hypothetical protein
LCGFGEQGTSCLIRISPLITHIEPCGSYHRTRHTLQDIQANTSKTVDVGVVDFGQESDLGRSHGIVFGQEQFKTEDSTFVWRLAITRFTNRDFKVWMLYLHMEIALVHGSRHRNNAGSLHEARH